MDNKDILANILSTTSEIKGKLQTINDNLTNLNTECLPACEQGVELGLANTVIANLEEKKLIHSRISECGKAVWEIEKACHDLRNDLVSLLEQGFDQASTISIAAKSIKTLNSLDKVQEPVNEHLKDMTEEH